MVTLEWKDEYNLGVKIIDAQHRRFLDMINNLSESIYSDNLDLDKVYQTATDLEDYTKVHL